MNQTVATARAVALDNLKAMAHAAGAAAPAVPAATITPQNLGVQAGRAFGAKAVAALPKLITLDPNWRSVQHPPRRFAWFPYLPAGCVSLLIGEGAVGKSTLLLTVLAHVAAGAMYLGGTVTAGRVVYIAAEDDGQEVLTRLQRVVARMRLTPAQQAALDKNFTFYPVAGSELNLLRADYGVVRHTPLVQALADDIGNALVVAFDPVSRIHGCEENSNIVSTKLVQAGEVIAQKTGASVVFAHHTGKAAARDELDDAYSARGGSGFADGARSVLRMMAPGPESASVQGLEFDAAQISNGNIIRLRHAKASYAAKAADTWLERGPQGELIPIQPMPATPAGALGQLKTWWLGSWNQKPFARSTIRDCGTVIFGKGGCRRAMHVIDQAISDGVLIETKGPRRGQWYAFADATPAPALIQAEIAERTATARDLRDSTASPEVRAEVDAIKRKGVQIEMQLKEQLGGLKHG